MSYPNSPGPDHILGISVKLLICAFITITTLTGLCNKEYYNHKTVQIISDGLTIVDQLKYITQRSKCAELNV